MIKWKGEEGKALLVWLISDTPEHREFLAKELKGSLGAIETIYASKKNIIENFKYPKFYNDKSYDKILKEFKEQGIKPDAI